MNILSNYWEVKFDEKNDALLIIHPDRQEFQDPMITIRCETLNEMSFKEASKFIGERLILLIPPLREMYKDYLWSENGQQAPKKLEPEDVAYRVGGRVLNILGLWHKKEFGEWGVPPTEKCSCYDEYVIALRLIGLAMSIKTSKHNDTIDLLLRHAATDNEEAKKYLEEVWPLLRDRID